jgi:hypothetical protein
MKSKINLLKINLKVGNKSLENLNVKGMKYAALSEGYKNFETTNPNTLKKSTYGIDYGKTIDPLGTLEGKKLKTYLLKIKQIIELNRKAVFESQSKTVPESQIKKIAQNLNKAGFKVKPGIKYYGDNIVTPIKQGEHAGEYHLRLSGGDREVFYGSKQELEKVLNDYKLNVRQRTDIDTGLVKKLVEDANKGDKFKLTADISDEYNKIKGTNIRLSGKTKDSPVYDILSTLESQDEKINKVFDSLSTSDQPVNFSFYESLPKDKRGETVANPWRSEIAGRTGIEQAKIKRVLNKNPGYLTNKIFLITFLKVN